MALGFRNLDERSAVVAEFAKSQRSEAAPPTTSSRSDPTTQQSESQRRESRLLRDLR
jgi:hypothetical protein